MAENIQVAAYEGGKMRLYTQGERTGEAVLALPLSRLIVKMVRVPADQRETAAEFVTPVLKALSPYPDEPLTVSCEIVREGGDGVVAIAAALPESSTDDIAAALDEQKLNVTHVDVLALGALRRIWTKLGVNGPSARRLLLLAGEDCISLIVLDGDGPSAIRAVNPSSDLRREVMLSLLEAEDFGGQRELSEIVLVGDVGGGESLATFVSAGWESEAETIGEEATLPTAFVPVRRVAAPEPDEALIGVAERTAEGGALDALPDSWREVLGETRFKAKMRKGLAVAGGAWLLAMGVLFGVPLAYGFMRDHQKDLSRQHQRQYRAVAEMRDKVKLVRKYSDHSLGALEMLKTVSDRLPDGVELTSWNFKREEGVKFSGESSSANAVYAFKDALAEVEAFEGVDLQGPTAGKGGMQRFDIFCRYRTEEE